jgi:Tol biopolymer transport system component
MTMRDGFEQTLSTFLHAEAPAREPEYLGEVAAMLGRTRQRPAWTNPERWLGGVVAPWTPARVPRAAWLLLALALLVATAVAIVAVGQRPTTFPWSGPGANGLIAFEYNGRIAVANADGTNRRFLTAPAGVSAVGVTPDGLRCCDGSMAWSPDGRRLAFLRSVGREAGLPLDDLMVVDADGSNLRILAAGLTPAETYGYGAEGSQALVAPAWSPDGDSLAVTVYPHPTGTLNSRLAVVDVGTGELRDPLPAAFWSASAPAWSPDGRELAFVGAATMHDSSGVFVVRTDGSDVRNVSAPFGDGGVPTNKRPIWTADGRWLIAAVDTALGGDLVRLATDGTGASVVATGLPSDVAAVAISPDGQQAAYYINGPSDPAVDSTPGFGLAAIDLPTGAVRVLLVGGLQPGYPLTWSPDGKRVLVLPRLGATVRLWAVDATGSGAPVELSIGPISSRVANGQTIIGDGWDRDLTYAWQRLAP